MKTRTIKASQVKQGDDIVYMDEPMEVSEVQVVIDFEDGQTFTCDANDTLEVRTPRISQNDEGYSWDTINQALMNNGMSARNIARVLSSLNKVRDGRR